MPWFIKTERFTDETLNLSPAERKQYLNKHCSWVNSLRGQGTKISSGYLINEKKLAGGGGFLIFEAESFKEAKSIVEQDPMISYGLVHWNLHEWVPIVGKLTILS